MKFITVTTPQYLSDLPHWMGKISRNQSFMIKTNQRSEEWYKLRNTLAITASEVSTLLGQNPFMTRNNFYKEKMIEKLVEIGVSREGLCDNWSDNKKYPTDNNNTDTSYKERMQKWGIDMEETAINIASYLLDEDIKPSGLFIDHGITGLIGASPDGIITDQNDDLSAIVECKCPFNQQIYKNINANKIPVYHYIQIQTQLMVTKAPFAWYVIYIPTCCTIYKIERDAPTWRMIDKAIDDLHKHVYIEVNNFIDCSNVLQIYKLQVPGRYRDKSRIGSEIIDNMEKHVTRLGEWGIDEKVKLTKEERDNLEALYGDNPEEK